VRRQEAETDAWLSDAVLLQLPSGRTRYLIQVHYERCEQCSSGTRIISIWASVQGRCEEVAWCGHCFNATCEPVQTDEDRRQRLRLVKAAISEGRVSPVWHGARPAVEDLRNRGFI
jgi:hypothetical protein